MVEPSKVKEAFKKVEKENYAFRVYLKNHADPDELDAQFLELHKELFKNYDCSKCRNCCKEYSPNFEIEELAKVAAFLDISKGEFMDKYIKISEGDYVLNTKPCCFLTAEGTCQIEPCKPEGCRDYPFTDKPDRLFSLYGILGSAEVCPVVFEMLERLKDMYGYRQGVSKKAGRNDLCPCGSGKKYKKCCGKN